MSGILHTVRTKTLEIAFEEHGPKHGQPVILLHGFPYAPRGYDDLVPLLPGYRVIVPYLRGYGPTRFLSPDTLRSGQQAALGADLRDMLDALDIAQAALVGFDWGGRAACIVAALWPERVRALVSCNGYNIQNIATANRPASAEGEMALWYQYYFNTPRGVAGLAANRAGIARLLWKLWSPNWHFNDASFAASAAAFDNPDFVDVVIHSYRHRYGNVAGDPAFDEIEAALAFQPNITVPSAAIWGEADGVNSAYASGPDISRFTGPCQRILQPGIGHNPPQEAPQAVADALIALLKT